MKINAILVVLLIIFLNLNIRPISAQQNGELLNNEKIVKMVKAGLGDNVIIEKIRRSATAFDVSTDKLIELKNQGISDIVLEAMIKVTPKDISNQNTTSNQNRDKSQSISNETTRPQWRVISPEPVKPRQSSVPIDRPKNYSNNPPDPIRGGSTIKRNMPVTEDGLPVTPGSRAVVMFNIKYRQSKFFSEPSRKADLCGGILTVGQTLIRLELTGGKSFQGRDCPAEKYEVRKDKFFELKDSSREKWYGNTSFSDYIYLKFAITDEKNKDKTKEFLIYPTEATVVVGTRSPALTGTLVCSNCSAIVCRGCEKKLDEMKTLLQGLANKSSIKIAGQKIKTGNN